MCSAYLFVFLKLNFFSSHMLLRAWKNNLTSLQSSLGSSASSFQSVGSYGPFGRMPTYSQFSPSSLVGQQFGTVGVGMCCFFLFSYFFCNLYAKLLKIQPTPSEMLVDVLFITLFCGLNTF